MRNKVLGSTLIIAGTAVGAGMLAMPLTSAEMGFGLTFSLLFILWALLTYTALLYAEVHQYDKNDAGIASLTERYFGKAGRIFVNLTLLLFMYAVLTAYVTASGDLLFEFLPTSLTSDPIVAQKTTSFIFAILFGLIVVVGIGLADITNRLFFIGKVGVFILVLYLLFNNISFENLQAKPTNSLLLFSATPVFFMTFGFHICTPTINEYLGGDNKKLKLSCFLGSTGIFIIYIIWQLATHGVLEQNQLIEVLNQDPSPNGLITAFEVTTGSKTLSEIVRIFSILALITSYIGVALGLSSAVKDLLLHLKITPNRFIIGIITFIPPIIIGLAYPNLFVTFFAFAGIIFAFIGVIIPITLAYKARKANPNGAQTAGGNIALIIGIIAAIIIIVSFFLEQAGYLPKVIG